jgi:hypothetical protein
MPVKDDRKLTEGFSSKGVKKQGLYSTNYDRRYDTDWQENI